ncbi:MAG TPA: PEP-CTERM sorting domain-containing protein [Phycisphaerae bacterium]|nr:PEP-CTERM sorting domain-containing protein [Phycisphaerae bacterium]HRW53729.1 PEP-CTERM sorting domain-containing protein [Phycisphaerae bacterium]
MKSTPLAAWIVVAAAISTASASIPHFEGFEDPGWTAGQPDNWQNYVGGDIQRVASGTAGITSSAGTGHGILTNLSVQPDVFNNPSLGASSPYTRFGGYSTSFGGGYTASLDVYLDTGWTAGQGFDYSVAANGTDNAHKRDFIFHVGVVGGQLMVNASNNSDYNYNSFKLINENAGNKHVVAASGWYTLEHVFYDNAGLLSVDFNLRDSGGSLLWSVTRGGNPADMIPSVIGGNRYGWFTYNNIDGLAIDNVSLVPEPSSIALLLIGGVATLRRRR